MIDALRLHGLIGSAGGSVKSVQRGSTTIPISSSTVSVTINEIDVSKSVIMIKLFSTAGTTIDAKDYLVQAKITNSTTITFTNGGSTSSYPQIYWEVVEFDNVKSKQTGTVTATTTSGNEYAPTITAVDTTKSILIATCYYATSITQQRFSCIASRIYSSTQIRLIQQTYTTYYWHWQVIEFN